MKSTDLKKISYRLLLVAAVFFMGIGYASVNGTTMKVEGSASAYVPESVLITGVEVLSPGATGNETATVNVYTGTMLDSTVELDQNRSSQIKMKITVYNNTTEDQMYVGMETDDTYAQSNIECVVDPSTLVMNAKIPAKESHTFKITFKFKDDAIVINNHVLNSKINFKFGTQPRMAFRQTRKQRNSVIQFTDLYPGKDIDEYKFEVTNTDTNDKGNADYSSVDMDYSFEVEFDVLDGVTNPFRAEIYKTGETVDLTKSQASIKADGPVIDDCTLKLKWNEGIVYDAEKYADKVFTGTVKLKARPQSDEYKDYEIVKTFNISMKLDKFHFKSSLAGVDKNIYINNTDNIENKKITVPIQMNSYLSYAEFNKFDTEYEITIDNKDIDMKKNLTLSCESENVKVEDGKIKGKIDKAEDSSEIQWNYVVPVDITVKDIDKLSDKDSIVLNIDTKKPYVLNETIEVVILLHPLEVTFNANGGQITNGNTSKTVYLGQTYGDMPVPSRNGYIFAHWSTSLEAGDIIDSTTMVEEVGSQRLYAIWTERPDSLVDEEESTSLPEDFANNNNIINTTSPNLGQDPNGGLGQESSGGIEDDLSGSEGEGLSPGLDSDHAPGGTDGTEQSQSGGGGPGVVEDPSQSNGQDLGRDDGDDPSGSKGESSNSGQSDEQSSNGNSGTDLSQSTGDGLEPSEGDSSVGNYEVSSNRGQGEEPTSSGNTEGSF